MASCARSSRACATCRRVAPRSRAAATCGAPHGPRRPLPLKPRCADSAAPPAAPPQPWEDNFAIALDFCTFHTRRHPFPEPDAAAIAASFAALSSRFDAAAQLDKRAALDALLLRFRAAPLHCEAPVRSSSFFWYCLLLRGAPRSAAF